LYRSNASIGTDFGDSGRWTPPYARLGSIVTSEGGGMSTKAGTIGIAGRPTGFVVWTGIVSALAAAALIMSAVALIEARRDGGGEAIGIASSQAPLWDAGKLEAMRGRVLAESVGSQDYVLWDEAKLDAMAGRVLATSAGGQGYVLWDAGKLDAMAGRVLAEGAIHVNPDYVLWDEAKLEAMAGRALAGN
jgi:hypothetical protein